MAEKHIHKFKRLKYKSGNVIFFCSLPDCTSKINPALALGKRSICWRCGKDFIMSEYSLRLAKPHCDACHKHKKGEEVTLKDAIEAIDNITPLTLAERLQQINEQANQQEEDEI